MRFCGGFLRRRGRCHDQPGADSSRSRRGVRPMNAEDFETLDPPQSPSRTGKLTNQQILLGQKHDPSALIKLYSQNDWEEFIREWVESLRGRYREVRRASGAGDKGRDVVGYVGEINE